MPRPPPPMPPKPPPEVSDPRLSSTSSESPPGFQSIPCLFQSIKTVRCIVCAYFSVMERSN